MDEVNVAIEAARTWAKAAWPDGEVVLGEPFVVGHFVVMSIGYKAWLEDDDVSFMTDGSSAVRVNMATGVVDSWAI